MRQNDPITSSNEGQGKGYSSGNNTTNNEGPQSKSNYQLPSINLPNGGGAIKGIDEKFKVNAISGTSSCSIPLPFSPGRNGFIPSFGLMYNSGAGNSPFGLGWQIEVPSITRKTENALPAYRDAEESDTFILSGAEDLVPFMEADGAASKKYTRQRTLDNVTYTISRYLPRIEGLFAKIERWQNNTTGEVYWRTISQDNLTSYYGLTPESRVSDPADPKRVFQWLLCRTHDDKGSLSVLSYKKEDLTGLVDKMSERNRVHNCTQTYLKRILYSNKKPYYAGDALPPESDFLFRTVLDYGEHDTSVNLPKDIDVEKNAWTCRKDPFSSYQAGFEIRTYRRCSRVLMFHCFAGGELPLNPYLVRSLQLFYDETLLLNGNGGHADGFSFLVKARQNGHLWDDTAQQYTTKYLPELELQYQQHQWDTTVRTVTQDSLVHAPAGIDDKTYLWVDLYSEGVGGILTEQAGHWYYKSNLGNGQFTHAASVASKPSLTGLNRTVSLEELEGDGVKYLVKIDEAPKGFFKLTEEDRWEPMKSFEQLPVINFSDPNIRFLDLDGDRRPDILYTEESALRWYRGQGEKGFDVSLTIMKEVDEEKGPAIVFSDVEQCIFLADMSGDGLTDIVRIRNGEVCYWPNKGYGHFGGKVNMDHAPLFDQPGHFNPAYLRLADIDGSGTTDIIYLGKNDFRVWMNLNGNEWSPQPQVIAAFPQVDSAASISVFDFLGTGTASIVCSSPVAGQPLQYIDLMGSKKPCLLTGYKNNCGKEVTIEYKTSTQYYLADKLAGIPWITRLPFPVHCIARLTTVDRVRETVFVNTFSYRHGYYDFSEKEFRGFARVEQNDTEVFSDFKLNSAKNVVEEDLHQPPVRSVSWFHTGAYLPGERLLHQCAGEYFQNTLFAEYNMPEPVLPPSLSAIELREALRACKGLHLRTEVYALDGSALQDLPYTATQESGLVRLVQAKGANKYASFLLMPTEGITYSYERIPADPRVAHSFSLETDELGNPTRSAMVIYPRVARPTGAAAIPDTVWEEQNKLHITYNETSYTNDVLADDVQRLRLLCESKGYEVSGLPRPTGFYFRAADLAAIGDSKEIQYEEEFSGAPEKRLSAHGRIYFMKDDLSGPLALGVLPSLGMLHKNYQLAFTKNLVTKQYGDKVTEAMLTDAGYTHTEGDGHWWSHGSMPIFPAAPADSFYIPLGSRDVFGREARVQFDAYTLLVHTATDPIGRVTTSLNDYRMLSPVLVTDPNRNRSAVSMDELGFVTRVAVMGKEGAGEGDTLADPGKRIEFDLFNWQKNGRPNYVHTFAREQHGVANPRWQESYAYSDGSGGVIMAKGQVHPGKAKVWNSSTKQVEEVDANPRWAGNGRAIVNNKGNAVKRYDPYFSTTFEYESESELVETGVTSVRYYDPLGRNIRTVNPNGTFSKIEFDSWYFRSFDVNDTVKDSQWYVDRGSPDPATVAEPSDPEKRAAWLAAKHYNTPNLIHSDSIGRPLMTVTDRGNGKTASVRVQSDTVGRFSRSFDQLNREVSMGVTNVGGAGTYSQTAEKGETWVFQDVEGRIYRVWTSEGRSYRFAYDELNRPVSSFLTEGGTEYLYSHMVYGETLPDDQALSLNMKGQVYQVYDQSGVVTTSAIDFKGNALQVEKRFTREYKQLISWSVLNGLTDIAAIKAAAEPLLEAETFVSSGTFDALSRPVTVILPDHSIVQPTYNEANFIDRIDAKIRGEGNFVNFLAGQDYNAKGQRQYAKYGNGVLTKYFYDALTFRLVNLVTNPGEAADNVNALQNISYTYDPVGNITEISDAAQQTYFFRNSVVFPDSRYEYDPIYQLVKASGREHAGQAMNGQRDNNDLPFIAQLPELNDSGAVRNYTEQYVYDDCGNILSLQHMAAGANWTQRYRYQYQLDAADRTNRLKATSLPGDADGVFSNVYAHTTDGNMSSMPHLSAAGSMVWNFQSQLKEVNLGGGGKAYYVYGPGGKRQRKVIERIGGRKIERIYLGAVEIYRESQGAAAADLERTTLTLSDNAGRIAQVDIKTKDSNNSDPANVLNAVSIRYQYNNHLGSAALETDATGNIISYEEYHPFGTSSYRVFKPGADASLKRYRFTGKERDEETGFYCFDTRYYAAWLGRWTSRDPAGFVDGLNLFEYCTNNPIMIHDPSGMDGKSKLHTENVVPTSIHTAAEFAAWAKGAGIRYKGTPVRGPNGGWNVKAWIRVSQGHGGPVGPAHARGNSGGGGPAAKPAPAEPAAGDGQPQATAQGGTGGPEAPAATTPTPEGSAGGVAGGSPDGKAGGGSTAGSPGGKPNGVVGGQSDHPEDGGRAPGNNHNKRTFWSRGGSTLLAGLLLLGAGLLTVLTAGAATPLLVLASGAMATAGGIAVTTTSAIQLGISYAGGSSAQQDKEVSHAISTAASLSSPGGLTGGTVGLAVDGERGMQRGALIGNLAEAGVGVGRWATTRFSSGSYRLYSADPVLAKQATTMPSTVPEGMNVLSSHGAPGYMQAANGWWYPISDLAPIIQSNRAGNVTILACNVAQDPAAVQALANQTGRNIGAFDQGVGAWNFGEFVNSSGEAIQPLVFTPQYLSPYLNILPNIAAPTATTAASIRANREQVQAARAAAQ